MRPCRVFSLPSLVVVVVVVVVAVAVVVVVVVVSGAFAHAFCRLYGKLLQKHPV